MCDRRGDRHSDESAVETAPREVPDGAGDEQPDGPMSRPAAGRYVAGIDVDLLVAETVLRQHLRRCIAADRSHHASGEIGVVARALRRELHRAAREHDREQHHAGRHTITLMMRRRIITDIVGAELARLAGVEPVDDLRCEAVRIRAMGVASRSGLWLTGPGAWIGARSLIMTLHQRWIGETAPTVLCCRSDCEALTDAAAFTTTTAAAMHVATDLRTALDEWEMLMARSVRQHNTLQERAAPVALVACPTAGATPRISAAAATAPNDVLAILIGDRPPNAIYIHGDGILATSRHGGLGDLTGERLYAPPGPSGGDLLRHCRISYAAAAD